MSANEALRMWRVDIAAVERPYPGKGHDRVFVDAERRVAAVFDGAGNDRASSLAVQVLEETIHHSDESLDAASILRAVQRKTVRQFAGRSLTTGTVVKILVDNDTLKLDYASAGDSPIFQYTHHDASIRQLTVDESQRYATHIDASNFLGSPTHELRQWGSVPVEVDTTLVLATDGITDEYYEGHATMADIAQAIGMHSSPQAIGQAVLETAAEFDDASVVVIAARRYYF